MASPGSRLSNRSPTAVTNVDPTDGKCHYRRVRLAHRVGRIYEQDGMSRKLNDRQPQRDHHDAIASISRHRHIRGSPAKPFAQQHT